MDKIILCFGKQEAIEKYMLKADPFARIFAVHKRHEFMGYSGEVECVHCGGWDSQTYNLYIEAVAYYKKVPAPHQYL